MAKPLTPAEKELLRTNELLKNIRVSTEAEVQAFRDMVQASALLRAELSGIDEDLENLGDKFSLVKNNALEAAANVKRQFQTLVGNTTEASNPIKEVASAFNSLATRVNTSLRRSTSLVEDYNDGLLESKSIEKELKSIKLNQLEVDSLKKSNTVENNAELGNSLANYEAILRDQKKALEQQLKFNRSIDAAVGLTGNLAKGFQKIPVIGDILDLQSFNQELREVAQNAIQTNKSFVGFRVLGSAVKSLGGELAKLYKDPLVSLLAFTAVLKELYNGGVKFNVESTKIARNYGISLESAKALYAETSNILANTKSEFLTRSSIVQAQAELNSEFGTTAQFSDDLIDGQARLTKGLGMSAEESAKLTNLALLNNTNQTDLVKTITSQNKGLISNKKVLQEVSKVEGQLAVLYKNDAGAIAKAVVQAEKLGMSIQQTKNATDKLLDFESSIQAQMEAEVLTGQTLNMDRARSLALQGKSVEAAEEMLRNVGGLQSFQKLNVIQQEAIASAMGMSADELSKTLIKQQSLAKLGAQERAAIQKYRDAGKGELADQLEKRLNQNESLDLAQQHLDTQEKMNTAVERLKDSFASIAEGPMATIAENLAGIVNWISQAATSTGGKWVMGLGAASISIAAIYNLIKKAKGALMGGKDQNDGSPTRPWYVKITDKAAELTQGLTGKIKNLFKRKKKTTSSEEESYDSDSGPEDILQRTAGRSKEFTGGKKGVAPKRGDQGRMLSTKAILGPETTPAQTISEMFQQQPQAPTAAPKSLAGQVEALKRENPGMTSREALSQIKGAGSTDLAKQATPLAPAAEPSGPASIAEAVKEQIKEQAVESAATELPSVGAETTPDLTREVAQAAPGKKRGFFGRMFKGKQATKIGGKLGKLGRGAGNLLKGGMKSGMLQGIASMALSSYVDSKAEAGEEPSILAQGASTLVENTGTISDLAQLVPKPGAASPSLGVSAPAATPMPTVAPAAPAPTVAPRTVATAAPKSMATQVEALKRANPGMTSKQALSQIKSTTTGAKALGTVGQEVSAVNTVTKEAGLLGKVGGFFGKAFSGIGKTLGKGVGAVKGILQSPIAKVIGKVLGPVMAVASSIGSVVSEISSAKERQAAGESVNTGTLGKKIVQGAAYPIANFLLTLGPPVGTALSVADGLLSLAGISPLKYVTDHIIDLIPDDAFAGLGNLALGNKSAGAPTARPATPATATPKLAAGGVVTKGGIAEVDPGEVYLGKSTRDSFSELVKDTKVQTNLISESKSMEGGLLRQSQTTSQLLEKLISQSNTVTISKDSSKELQSTAVLLEKINNRISNNSIENTAKSSVEKLTEVASKSFTNTLTPVTIPTRPVIEPAAPVDTLKESTVREMQATTAKVEKTATSTKETTVTAIESKQSLDALLRAVKEQTTLLAAIRDKRLVIEADKLAYATAKATFTSYGNPLNSTSYTT